jgi:DNA-directed RNA polymerase subunit RPC12/RpoP
MILKCKMCGGQLNIESESSVCECEYCGSKQTIPNTDDEKRLKLYERANRLRFDSEFDKAAGVYESIVADYQEEAEAYWGLVLCKYGIEYVDDPATGKKVPTCHRSSFDSVMDDPNFELVMENADVVARGVYREEAKRFEEIRKGIIEVSSTEEPYDIFICYKETDDKGDRTIDSVIAQDVYNELTEKGYRVFFSRITLEDKLGQEYEPYIFAALNSAKVMLAFGTSYDYYNAVWVKNEWSRFLKLIAEGQKKTLIPCYKDIDAYDMPKEFKHLQAQDMGKVGADQDLIRGIDKIFGNNNKTVIVNDTGSIEYTSSVLDAKNAAQLKRGFIALEDGEWDKANNFFEEVLNYNAECAEAYLGEFLSKDNSKSLDEYREKWEAKIRTTAEKMKSNENQLETYTACDADLNLINLIVNKYSINRPDATGLSETEIRNAFEFDRNYSSSCNALFSYKDRFLKGIEDDKQLSRAKAYADDKLKTEIEAVLKSFELVFDDLLSKEEAEKKKKDEATKEGYRRYVELVADDVKKRNEEYHSKRAADYELIKKTIIDSIEDRANLGKYQLESLAKDLKSYDEMPESEELLGALLKEIKYQNAILLMSNNAYDDAKNELEELNGYKESAIKLRECDLENARIKVEKEEEERKRAEEKEKEQRQIEERLRIENKRKRKRKRIVAFSIIGILLISGACLIWFVVIPNIEEGKLERKYLKAEEAVEKQQYEEAAKLYAELGDYKKSQIMNQVLTAYNAADYFKAISIYQDNEEDIDITSKERIEGLCVKRIYEKIDSLLAEKEYDQALAQYNELACKISVKLYRYDSYTIEKARDFCGAYKELINIDDGEEHDVGGLYDALGEYGYNYDENPIFRYILSLNGEWLFVKQIDHEKSNKEWIPDSENQVYHGLRINNGKWEYIDKRYTGFSIKYKSGKYYLHLFDLYDYDEIKEYTVGKSEFTVFDFDKDTKRNETSYYRKKN